LCPEDGICHNLAAFARADRYEPVQGTQLLEELMQMGYQPSGRILVQVWGWSNMELWVETYYPLVNVYIAMENHHAISG